MDMAEGSEGLMESECRREIRERERWQRNSRWRWKRKEKGSIFQISSFSDIGYLKWCPQLREHPYDLKP